MPRMQRPLILLAATVALLTAWCPPALAKRKVPHGFYGVMWDRAATERARRWSRRTSGR